ncbi:hypothetical protein CDL12_20171 [Handroanthus impetiginosus]|uniref:S-protein homolog n=1 Tax=Handroanthus impetiginosus TaxID=429701 RepID=A0A2G9GPW7_9LAMI|nr:hypothetical protein CDL12_20171 [Handroanthus impetiginosus]
MRRVLLFVFIMVNILHALANQPNCFLTPKVIVYIANGLSEPLYLHCESKHDDLKDHILVTNQDFYWSFCETIDLSTKFTCKLLAPTSKRVVSFCAYESLRRDDCIKNKCLWIARDDGIYFFGSKYYDWNPIS